MAAACLVANNRQYETLIINASTALIRPKAQIVRALGFLFWLILIVVFVIAHQCITQLVLFEHQQGLANQRLGENT